MIPRGRLIPPVNWKETLECIRKMRKSKVAPVDSMGCHKCFDSSTDDKTRRFQILVSLMLSSQTKDEVTHAAMLRLRNRGLTVNKISDIELKELQNLLYPKKALYLKKVAQILLNEYEGDIPNDVENLLKLPGVGPKMAYLAMNVAWNNICGIGVDTHMHRILKRIAWVPFNSRTPEDTRKALESWLPKEEWKNINELLVGFGQEICTPTNPKCSDCLLLKTCPFANNSLTF